MRAYRANVAIGAFRNRIIPNGGNGPYGQSVMQLLVNKDQPIVPSKQGNACGGKGLTVEPLGQGHIFRTQIRVKDGNKTGLITYLINDREVSSEEPDEGKPQVRFCEGAHSNLGAITPLGGAL